MNKFFAFAFLAFCGVASSQVIPVGPLGPLNLPMYQSDLIATHQIGGGSSSSSAASAAASSSSAAGNDIIASRINALNVWPLGHLGGVGSLGPVGPMGVVGPLGPLGSLGPIVQHGGSSSSAAAAAAAAASSSAAQQNALLNSWSPLVGGPINVNPWVGPIGNPGLISLL